MICLSCSRFAFCIPLCLLYSSPSLGICFSSFSLFHLSVPHCYLVISHCLYYLSPSNSVIQCQIIMCLDHSFQCFISLIFWFDPFVYPCLWFRILFYVLFWSAVFGPCFFFRLLILDFRWKTDLVSGLSLCIWFTCITLICACFFFAWPRNSLHLTLLFALGCGSEIWHKPNISTLMRSLHGFNTLRGGFALR